MEKTWKPTAAGILCIMDGVICVIPGILVALFFAFMGSGLWKLAGAPLLMIGIIAIVGGIYALRRRVWGLAFAGSVVTLVGFGILVVFAILVIVLSPVILSDAPDIIPFDATFDEALAIIWGDWELPVIVGSVILGSLGILPIIFIVKGKREFK